MTVYFLESLFASLLLCIWLCHCLLLQELAGIQKKERERRQWSRKHTIISLDRFITLIVRFTSNHDMEMTPLNLTYAKNSRRRRRRRRRKLSSQASQVPHKGYCLPRIRTDRYIYGSYIVIKALYILSLSYVLCSSTDSSARSTTNLNAHISLCLCRSTLLSMAKRKKPPSHTKVFFINNRAKRATMMTSYRHCDGKKTTEGKEGRKWNSNSNREIQLLIHNIRSIKRKASAAYERQEAERERERKRRK